MIDNEQISVQKDAIQKQLDEIRNLGLADLKEIQDEAALQEWHRTHLGRKAAVMDIMREMSSMPGELRPIIGKYANEVKQSFEKALQERTESIKKANLERSLEKEQIDVTLPGRRPSRGRLHPETQALREINQIFLEMGFQIYRSPDVETDEYNFELLNMPPHHPARDMWDTFYTTNENVILRTHTSPGQIHVMRQFAPEPIRAILPGMCYRYEQITARSEIQFNQVELIVVGKNITFGDLKGTLQDFVNRLFGREVRTRLRPNHFPFTEPSAEMDVECFICGGQGCPVCKKAGWLEILGCGMVHPTVLKNGGYDPEVYSGFAAGLGPERINMLRHKIEDIRYFWSNDVRFLEQF